MDTTRFSLTALGLALLSGCGGRQIDAEGLWLLTMDMDLDRKGLCPATEVGGERSWIVKIAVLEDESAAMWSQDEDEPYLGSLTETTLLVERDLEYTEQDADKTYTVEISSSYELIFGEDDARGTYIEELFEGPYDQPLTDCESEARVRLEHISSNIDP